MRIFFEVVLGSVIVLCAYFALRYIYNYIDKSTKV